MSEELRRAEDLRLKPCSMGCPVRAEVKRMPDPQGELVYLKCPYCSACGRLGKDIFEATDNWNTRPIEDQLRADLAAAEGLLKPLMRHSDSCPAELACPGDDYFCDCGADDVIAYFSKESSKGDE